MNRTLFFILLLCGCLTAFAPTRRAFFHPRDVAAAGGGGGGIAFHNVSSERVAPVPGTTETTTHTINSTLANGYIAVEIAMYDGADDGVSGVTFDGTSMTQIAAHNMDYFGEYRVYIYGLAVGSKAAGTYNVVTTFTSANVDDYSVGIVSYTGVHQTTSTGTSVDGSNSNSDTATVTVTSATGELVIGVCIKGEEDGVPDSGETERWDTVTASADTGWGGEEAGAASVVFAIDFFVNNAWCLTAIPLKPAP